MERNYVEETRVAAERSIAASRLAYDAAHKGTMKAEELLAIVACKALNGRAA